MGPERQTRRSGHLGSGPVPGRQDQITERVEQVTYTAKTPFPDGYPAHLDLQVELPVVATGTVLSFPTVQTCEQGEAAWTQIPAKGQDPEELESPAPSIEVASPTSTTAASGSASSEAEAALTSPTVPVSASGISWGVAGFLAGLAGLAAGSSAFLRGSRNKS